MTGLTPKELRQELVSCTITSGNVNSQEKKRQVFFEYAKRAFPKTKLSNFRVNDTAAALNSISALADLTIGGVMRPVFLKIHIEDSRIADVGDEYKNSQLLAEAGWPIMQPISQSDKEDYPLLMYGAFSPNQHVLFDVIQNAYKTQNPDIGAFLTSLNKLHEIIGLALVKSLTVDDLIDSSQTAPLQMFFGRRLDPGARADKWFIANRMFNLPGLKVPISWQDLSTKEWVINGEVYDNSLARILSEARSGLLFKNDNERKSYLVIAHGDDHPGNILLTKKADSNKVFDPAAAGLAPGSIASAKALAHTGILPMAGMYYDPYCHKVCYRIDGGKIIVDYNFKSIPVYGEHEAMARQVIDARIIPVFKAMRDYGADLNKEFKTLKSALAMCALLTVDPAMLLKKKDNLGLGLLPATVMLSLSKGLPSLNYMQEEIEKL